MLQKKLQKVREKLKRPQLKLTAENALAELKRHEDKEKAKFLSGFFKTKKGEYAEGDVFLGIVVPETRIVSRKFKELPTSEIAKLFRSEFHEARLLAVIILTLQFESMSGAGQEAIVRFYVDNRKYINNWDLVDLSAYKILGAYLYERDRKLIYQLANSDNLWEKRISVVSTYYFIKKDDFEDTIRLCEKFLTESHDLMHKACGWMLREVGKRDESVLLEFLERYAPYMPRTMLRYSIEKLPEELRQKYLKAG